MISIQGVRINENSISSYKKDERMISSTIFSITLSMNNGQELTFRYSSEKERDKVFSNLDTFFKLEACCDQSFSNIMFCSTFYFGGNTDSIKILKL